MRIALLLISIVLPLLAADEHKKDEEVDQAYIRAHYTKYEYMVPMRDGVRLHVSAYAPKDISQPYPILLQRTPYSAKPYGVDNYPDPRGQLKNMAKEKFIFAYQDVRGRYASEGEFVHMRPHIPNKTGDQTDESSDTYDTIEWLINNVPNNNGRVGMMGISYPGFYTAMGMIDSHPALKASSPQAPIADWFIGDDFHHNGAFYLAHAFRFLSGFGQDVEEPLYERSRPFVYKTNDGYEFYRNIGPLYNVEERYFKGEITFWPELMQHGSYDEFWQSRSILPHLKNVTSAVMTVGGWFDAEDLYGPLNIYAETEKNNPNAYNVLVMGPWRHGQWSGDDGKKLGHVDFQSKTGEFYREEIELPFFKHFLKDGAAPNLPEAYVFELGTHQWRRYDTWPPEDAQEQQLHFGPGGVLSFSLPTESGHEEYISDPDKPVPFIPNIAIGMTREHMLDDQRFASTRTDVLVFQTEPLAEDVTLAGPLTAALQISSTGTDSDFVVKLIDVYPGTFPNPDPNPTGVQMGNYQQLVRGEAMRAKFRNSYSDPEPLEPGQRTAIEYELPDVYHTFRKGHRIMVHIQSSWFPLVDRNPQKFVDIYNARPEDFQKSTQRIYWGPNASRLDVKVLP